MEYGSWRAHAFESRQLVKVLTSAYRGLYMYVQLGANSTFSPITQLRHHENSESLKS